MSGYQVHQQCLRDTWLGRAFRACFRRPNWAFGAVAAGLAIDTCTGPRVSAWVWLPVLLACWALGVAANLLDQKKGG